jgi:outer membrane protein OmpA-like peptidoglycan-associated protein
VLKADSTTPAKESRPAVADAGSASVDAAKVREQAQTIRQQAEQIKQLQTQLQSAQAAPRQSAGDLLGLTAANKHVDVVTAGTPIRVPDGKNVANVAQGGVIVQFNKDVIELTKEEMADLTEKIKRLNPLNASSKWRVTVIAPKGFSEAIRLGFYRANVVRNLLLQQGVQGSNIDLMVLESERGDADSARVIVRPGV